MNKEKSDIMEKSSSTKAERMNYLKSAIVAGIGAAGAGALVRSIAYNKTRKKQMDLEKAKDSIYVHIKKQKFLEGLPKPESFDKSESSKLEQINHDMSVNDINKMKRDILAGRKFDFFGGGVQKAAQECGGEEVKCEVGHDKPEKKEVTAEECNGRVVLRDQEGKFVSPTDPVAVEQVEKKAIDGIWDTIAHPIDSTKRVFSAAVDKPVFYTAGALGGLYLAVKLSDAVNSVRRKKSKKALAEARNRYISILEGEEYEKSAQSDIRDLTGATLGAAFVIPLALSAIVTNKIIENRKKEKDKEKQFASSFPDDPVILYKTAEGDDVEISPETALIAIMVKRAMIIDAEIAEMTMEKKSAYTNEDINSAADRASEIIMADENKYALLGVLEGLANGKNINPGESLFSNMDLWQQAKTGARESFHLLSGDDIMGASKDPRFIRRIGMNKKIPNVIISRCEKDPKYRAFRDKLINKGTNDQIRKWGFKPDGFLGGIIGWFIKTFGLGKSFFNDELRKRFGEMGNYGKNQSKKQVAAQTTKSQNQTAYNHVSGPLASFPTAGTAKA